MKITIDISQAQYQGTGVGTYTYNLVKHLLQLNTDHQIQLFGASLRGYLKLKKIASSLSPQHRIFPIPPTAMDYIFNQHHKINIENLTGLTNIFHASDWTQPATKIAKSVTTIHDLTIFKYPKHQHPKIVETHKRRLKWVKQEASCIIADSFATKKDIINHLDISESKIHVIYLAASEDFNQFSSLNRHQKAKLIQTLKKKYKLNNNYILSVGTNEPRKNLKRVIKAYQQYADNTPKSSDLAIAGRYGWGSKLSKQPPNIKTLGFVDQPDLPALYAGAQAFVYPSLYEGFGLPILEAMTVGTPVVTTKQGSLKEVAGAATVLVDPHSATSIRNGLIEALTKPKPLINKGLTQASKFSWEKTAKQTMKLYEQIGSKIT